MVHKERHRGKEKVPVFIYFAKRGRFELAYVEEDTLFLPLPARSSCRALNSSAVSSLWMSHFLPRYQEIERMAVFFQVVLVEKNQDFPPKLLVNGRSSWDGEEHLSAGRNQPAVCTCTSHFHSDLALIHSSGLATTLDLLPPSDPMELLTCTPSTALSACSLTSLSTSAVTTKRRRRHCARLDSSSAPQPPSVSGLDCCPT